MQLIKEKIVLDYTVMPRIRVSVNFDFRLKWFLYYGYLERNHLEVVLSWFLFPVKNNCSCKLNYCCFDKINACMLWVKSTIHASKITVFCCFFLVRICLLIQLKVR